METNKNLPSMPTPPPDVMDDPIALLDWLEKNADGITEQDPEGTAFLHVVPIGKPRPQLEAILGISALETML
ncbi:hypothetical protein [Bifidobacterium breve]|uniref:Uncharacterized protein n=1 Tax=Bifidobacterium breve TaxID=1685 RepID=A0AAP2Q324_BIFBR|nr:hypothetical protein [Bifidobacterium breve]MCB8548091.1 hypothetical protein [Bifidobacterium sp. MSK23_125]MCB8555453.1 hypothetical protein [Bifidobacterium sp. MSK23_139]AZI16489.1 hypothetical protein EH245_04285 [Bifidobacterium breve]MBU9891258.1 hypothetical protein [Bifidobacterium breve]MBV3240825.1 hypothetical protein [Bifidobacterium breve]